MGTEDNKELHLHVLQAMGLVDPQYSHCFLATEVVDTAAGDVDKDANLADTFCSDSSGTVSTTLGGSDSATFLREQEDRHHYFTKVHEK